MQALMKSHTNTGKAADKCNLFAFPQEPQCMQNEASEIYELRMNG